jgi:hypothetical protein
VSLPLVAGGCIITISVIKAYKQNNPLSEARLFPLFTKYVILLKVNKIRLYPGKGAGLRYIHKL